MIHLPYEKNIYSQNGEDGIIEQLTSAIKDCNKTFLEIGWGDGTCNMTRLLAERGWTGIGIDAMYTPSLSVKYPDSFVFRQMMVNLDNLAEAIEGTSNDVDFFSLDIDSFDFEVSRWILEQGYRPKTVCLEINPRFGASVQASFPFKQRTKKKIYRKTSFYGVSILKYKRLWESYGYKYFGYDSTQTNVFFYHSDTVNSLEHLPVHTLEEFPITQDLMESIISEYDFWNQYKQEIYNPL